MYEAHCAYDEATKRWTSAERHEIFNENVSAGECAFFMMNNQNPQSVMQISDSEDTVLTYGEALTAAIRIAQHFDGLKLNSDHVVSIFAPNTTYVMPVALAALFNCTPFQPMNTVMETAVIKQILERSRPKVIFCDGLHYEKLQKAAEEFQPLIYTICNHLDNVPSVQELLKPTATERNYRPKPLTKGPSQTLIIMLSSGTTGISKAICLSNSYCLNDLTLDYKYETVCSTNPIDWVTGLFTFLMNILRGGVRVITHKPCTPAYLLELITKYQISMLLTNPRSIIQLCALEECTQEKLSSLRLLLVGGSRCSEDNLKKMSTLITNGNFCFGYATTEMGGLTLNNHDNKFKSVGKLLPNLQMKIVDQSTGKSLGPNETGEVCIKRTTYAWLGYYKSSKATDEAIDSEGFFHTGDMGYMDEENFLYLLDRCQDVYKYLGYKWTPNEIETVVSEMSDVAEVCVFDIHDGINPHVPAAAVVAKAGSVLKAADVVDYVKQHIEVPYKHLDGGVFILEELPVNRNGKIMRNKLRELCMVKRGNGEIINGN